MLKTQSFETAKISCPARFLLRTFLVFGGEKGLQKVMYDFYLREYQLEVCGLTQYRKSNCDNKLELLDVLIALQTKYAGRLSPEFRCLGKLLSGLQAWVKPSKWETDPHLFKFQLTEAHSFWHISMSLQSHDFSCRKASTITYIVEIIKKEMMSRGIDILYGVFKKGILQNILDIFNEMNGESVTFESFEKFKTGIDFKCKPNQWHQNEIGMKRKTYYKLVNFLESLSPNSWVGSALDKRRLLDSEGLTKIRNKILEAAPLPAKLLWENDVGKSQAYCNRISVRKEKAKDEMEKCGSWQSERVFSKTLKPLKKRFNRLPLIERELTLFSLLRILKRRPCLLSPYKLMIRYSSRINVEAWSVLMNDVRSCQFRVSDQLKFESLRLDRERHQERVAVDRLIARKKFSAIKKAKKEARNKLAQEKSLEMQRLYLIEAEKREKARIEEERIAEEERQNALIWEQRVKEQRAAALLSRKTEVMPKRAPAKSVRSIINSIYTDLTIPERVEEVKKEKKEVDLTIIRELVKTFRAEMITELRGIDIITTDRKDELREYFTNKFLEKSSADIDCEEKRLYAVKRLGADYKTAYSQRRMKQRMFLREREGKEEIR
jgi:hypothetical protein